MQLLSSVARWALCACLLTITNPFDSHNVSVAQAQPKKGKASKANKNKGVRRCVKFQQTLGSDEESVDLQLTNQCKFEVVCSIEWDLQCSSSAGSSIADTGKQATTLDFSESLDVNASAGACETDWEIKNVRWQCVATEG
jgi:hypothetical protein